MSYRIVFAFSLLMVLGALAACRSTPTPTPVAEEEAPAIAVTAWSPRTELFMEYPPLVAGAQARFAIHLTNLEDFSPVREGRVVVRFEGESTLPPIVL